MTDMRTHLVFWWIIPCKAISGVFRELAELPRYRVTVVCVGDLSEERKRLGWVSPDFGKCEVVILPSGKWKLEVDRILKCTQRALHIYNGVHAYKRILYSQRKAINMNIRTAVMTEAYFNGFTGLKRLAKIIYALIFPPLITVPLAKRNLFVLSLSGNSETARRSLRWLGWQDNQIYPFGYFSEQPPEIATVHSSSHVSDKMLLCTGYLTRNKGQHILLHALSLLKSRGLHFHCNITGYGQQETYLQDLSRSLGLESVVTFKGTISTKELDNLMQTSDIFVAPGICEPWGIRINEALQAGLAVVVSDGIGACELVEASEGGVVFPTGNPEQLAATLIPLITNARVLADCKKRSRNYSKRISPRIAAGYFDQVLQHINKVKETRPTAPWL